MLELWGPGSAAHREETQAQDGFQAVGRRTESRGGSVPNNTWPLAGRQGVTQSRYYCFRFTLKNLNFKFI